jgi:putative toxin-antitoxin system antitoxin component (TIGR02293 family)
MATAAAIQHHAPALKQKLSKLNIGDNFAIVKSARMGVGTQLFFDFAQAINMPYKELSGLLNISSRTISNYHDKKKNLEPAYSEHLLKLIALFNKGEEIFGSTAEFNYWLRKPFWNARERPFDWLNTSGGIDLVTDEITKLAYGDAV